jgi:hypothetical protein
MMMGLANNNNSMYIMHLWLICLRWAMVEGTIWNSGWVDGTRVSEGQNAAPWRRVFLNCRPGLSEADE